MRRADRSRLAGCLLAAALAAACAPMTNTSEPREVILEGVVLEGPQFRLERPLDGPDAAPPADGDAAAIPHARVRLESADGEVVETEADASGRFRLGPVRIGGRRGDRLTVSSPGRWTLSSDALWPAELVRTDPDRTVTVRRLIALPPRPRLDPAARPAGQPLPAGASQSSGGRG